MRLLFLTHYFPPEGNAPASRTHEHCRRWVGQGQKVTVVTCAPNAPDGVLYRGYRNGPYQRETVDGIDVRRVWSFLAANKGTVRRIVNYLSYLCSATLCSLIVPRPDAVVATSPQFFCGWAGVLASRLRRVPLILEIRDIWPESIVAVHALSNRRLIRVLEWLERRMYRSARLIVTVGDGYRERILAKGVAPEKVAVLMNGVDRELFHPRAPDRALERRLGVEGKFICSYIGTIGMASGLDVVLRAAEILRAERRDDIVFLLVGEGARRGELQREAGRRGLDNVVFAGRQDKAEIPRFLSISDACLIHLRKTDLFTSVVPSKIFEASGMARPIILGVAGQAAKIVREAGAGLCIEPDNERELVAATQRLADDEELRSSMGLAGLDHVTRHYDRDLLAQRYLELIARSVGVDTAPVPPS